MEYNEFSFSYYSSFVLNTTISAPHEAQITALCFPHVSDGQTTMLVSTSRDGHFKAWQLAAPAHTEGKQGANAGPDCSSLTFAFFLATIQMFLFLLPTFYGFVLCAFIFCED